MASLETVDSLHGTLNKKCNESNDRKRTAYEATHHGTLDVQLADVLPPLLEQTDQEVGCLDDVAVDLLGGHVHVGHSHADAQSLLALELKLDGRLHRGQ